MVKFTTWKKNITSVEDVKKLTKAKRKQVAKACCNCSGYSCVYDRSCCIVEGDWDNKCGMFNIVILTFIKENK